MTKILLFIVLVISFTVLTTTLPSQVVIEFGDAELEYDPSTGQPAEDWSIPLLMSGGTDPVIAFAFEGRASFSGFIYDFSLNTQCSYNCSDDADCKTARLAAFGMDISPGVFATAEYVEIQHEWGICLVAPIPSEARVQHFSVGVIESIQGPFSGQLLDTLVPVGSLTISLSPLSLLNDLDGAFISVSPGTSFSPPIIPEVTYMNGTAAPLVGPEGTISFVRANSFKRGTFEAGDLTISDPVRALLYLFGGGETPSCFDSVDANDDGAVDLGDPVLVLTYLFAAGPAPLPPHSQCGSDLTPDALDCVVDICG
ncbi:MAG: hypothetical protein ABGX31_04600 [bacterium]